MTSLTFAICFALATDIHLVSGRIIFQFIDIAHKFSYDSRPYDSDARSVFRDRRLVRQCCGRSGRAGRAYSYAAAGTSASAADQQRDHVRSYLNPTIEIFDRAAVPPEIQELLEAWPDIDPGTARLIRAAVMSRDPRRLRVAWHILAARVQLARAVLVHGGER